MSKRSMKEWDSIMRTISSPENSDAEDSVNVITLQENAPKIVRLMEHVVPNLNPHDTTTLPLGMNNLSPIRDGISSAAGVVRNSASTIVHPMKNEKCDNLDHGNAGDDIVCQDTKSKNKILAESK